MNILNGFLVYRLIEDHIKTKKPLSLIRLGDGEGAMMGFPEFVSLKEARQKARVWFGDQLLQEDDFTNISQQLKTSIRNATIVGIPRKKQTSMHSLYEIVYKSIDRFDLLSKKPAITDAAIHCYLQFSLLFRPILLNKDFIGMISSRDLRLPLRQMFNIGHIELYQIKGENKFPGSVKENHYPDRFDWLKNNINIPYQGAIFLVGAGVLGKIYCDVIKEKGGIAIDIGAVFDAWANVKSRLKQDCFSFENFENIKEIESEKAIDRYNNFIELYDFDTPKAHLGDMQGSLDKW
jgi:hypothetical protein